MKHLHVVFRKGTCKMFHCCLRFFVRSKAIMTEVVVGSEHPLKLKMHFKATLTIISTLKLCGKQLSFCANLAEYSHKILPLEQRKTLGDKYTFLPEQNCWKLL